MKLKSVSFALTIIGTACAFTPHTSEGTQRVCLTELEMANGAMHKAALKVAGTAFGITLTTASLPAAVHAAGTAVESTKRAKGILSIGAGAFAAGIATSKLLKKLGVCPISKTTEDIEEVVCPISKTTTENVEEVLPNSKSN